MAIEVNFYDHLKECLTKDIKSLLKSAELVLAVPQKSGSSAIMTEQEIEGEWAYILNNLSNMLSDINTPKGGEDNESEKFKVIAMMLNLKDELLQQIFCGTIYRKMLIWTDLNILGSGSKENVVVVPQSKLKLSRFNLLRNRRHNQQDGGVQKNQEVCTYKGILPRAKEKHVWLLHRD